MRTRLHHSCEFFRASVTLGAVLCVLAMLAPQAFAKGGDRMQRAEKSVTPISAMKCPPLAGSGLIYAIGSSTLGSTLGPELGRKLKKDKRKFRKWGKASTGLARPDYHDWAKEVRNVAREWNPSLFLISLGSNDFQALKEGKKWISPFKEPHRWRTIYAKRVDKLLKAASGKGNGRAVVWITPNVFKGKKPQKIGRWVHDILVDRIKHFEGPAFLVDTYAATTNKDGSPRRRFQIPGKSGDFPLFASDGLHLSTRAVHSLMMDPALELIDRCLPVSR